MEGSWRDHGGIDWDRSEIMTFLKMTKEKMMVMGGGDGDGDALV